MKDKRKEDRRQESKDSRPKTVYLRQINKHTFQPVDDERKYKRRKIKENI